MNPQIYQIAKQRTMDFEGCKLKAYKDTENVWTIGRGHKILDHEMISFKEHGISQDLADTLFDEDFESHFNETILLPEWGNCSGVRQIALADMGFQMGIVRMRGFSKMRHFILKSQWEAAAWEIIDSQYFKQTPKRALSNAHIIAKGVLPV